MEKRVLAHAERAVPPESCAPPKLDDRLPVRATAEGLLSAVVVAASNFKRQPVRAPIAHEVVIDDCRLTPRTVAAMKGDQLRVRTVVDYPFMPAFGDTTGKSVRTLIPGQTYDVSLDKPGVYPLLCGFTAPCGRADVIVMLHPVHAVTDAEGKFRIDVFPAGETVTLSAWHPLFQESKLELRVEPGETKNVELVLTPVAQAAPAPPAEPAGKPSPKKPKAPAP
jgi:hypothetical protein